MSGLAIGITGAVMFVCGVWCGWSLRAEAELFTKKMQHLLKTAEHMEEQLAYRRGYLAGWEEHSACERNMRVQEPSLN